MSKFIATLLMLVVLFPCEAIGSRQTVERFIAAFNAKDVDGMVSLATPTIRWMSVDGDRLSIDAEGAEALSRAMTGYFSAIPTARSRLRSSSASGPFVHTVEEASWEAKGETRSQCSLGVYRLDEALIAEVWYFPAFECPAVQDKHE